MKTLLLVVGKTDSKLLTTLIDDYAARAARFVPFSLAVIPDVKATRSLTEAQQKVKEGEAILARLTPADRVVLLDEGGRQFSSRGFAEFVQQQFDTTGTGRLVFVVGGPYGFSEAVYARAASRLSLSLMTFSHQMVRLLFVEQFYRALTIIHHVPYHHD